MQLEPGNEIAEQIAISGSTMVVARHKAHTRVERTALAQWPQTVSCRLKGRKATGRASL